MIPDSDDSTPKKQKRCQLLMGQSSNSRTAGAFVLLTSVSCGVSMRAVSNLWEEFWAGLTDGGGGAMEQFCSEDNLNT